PLSRGFLSEMTSTSTHSARGSSLASRPSLCAALVRICSVTRTPLPFMVSSTSRPPLGSSWEGEEGSRPTDLVFGPTLACRGGHRFEGGLAPSPGPGEPGRGRTY